MNEPAAPNNDRRRNLQAFSEPPIAGRDIKLPTYDNSGRVNVPLDRNSKPTLTVPKALKIPSKVLEWTNEAVVPEKLL